MQQRILAIHDLSGFGHTSLLAEIPIMSRMVIEVAVLPTALLSANTDYPAYRMLDTTAFMQQSLEHWQQLGQRFDAIHSGFLGSPQQVQLLLKFLPTLIKPDSPILVDPVLGDSGKLYNCYTHEMISAMRNLLSISTIITPNYTEAAFLLNKDMSGANVSLALWCKELAKLGPQQVIITSAPDPAGNHSAVAYYNKLTGHYQEFYPQYEPVSYPGAGDCFASMLLAAMLRGFSIPAAIEGSIAFVKSAFHQSTHLVSDVRRGIALAIALNLDPIRFFSL